jgi:hypothetical protein
MDVYDRIRVVGRGAFGEAILVRAKTDVISSGQSKNSLIVKQVYVANLTVPQRADAVKVLLGGCSSGLHSILRCLVSHLCAFILAFMFVRRCG